MREAERRKNVDDFINNDSPGLTGCCLSFHLTFFGNIFGENLKSVGVAIIIIVRSALCGCHTSGPSFEGSNGKKCGERTNGQWVENGKLINYSMA